LDSYLNCGPINKKKKKKIADEIDSNFPALSASLVKGGFFYSRSEYAEHAYVRVKKEDRVIIVDGAIDQFSDRNEADNFFSLGPENQLPTVAVLDGSTERDRYQVGEVEWHNCYSEKKP
jgi:hypothetical protein